MDLLFSRYASPFILLDELIANKRFCDFVEQICISENDRLTWEFFLHKVIDKSYPEFLEELRGANFEENTEEVLEATVLDSISILNNFKPY